MPITPLRRGRRRVRWIVIVVRVVIFLAMLGSLLLLLGLGYDAVTAAGVLVLLVGGAVRATCRLLGDQHPRSSTA